MQVTGSQFTNTAALFGNDLSTFPDFPAEIRAPQGTLPGVSDFQVNFSSTEVHTPGDAVDVLIAMIPAAIKTNVGDLKAGGFLIVNKGLDLVVKALGHGDRPALLVVAGRPPDVQAPNLRYLGYRTDIEDVYRAVDATLVVSRYEPFGLVGVESVCCGTCWSLRRASAAPR